MAITMMQACRELDMTYQTLKYYCNQGLVPNVQRDKNNRRVFTQQDVEWIRGLICLRKCGMSIDEMRQYMELCLEGEPSIPARRTMLEETRERLVKQIEELQGSIAYIDMKQKFYDDVEAGRVDYYSNLIDCSKKD